MKLMTTKEILEYGCQEFLLQEQRRQQQKLIDKDISFSHLKFSLY